MSHRPTPTALAALLAAAALMLAAAASASAHTVWLCKPGQRPDPCTPGLSTTVYSPSLEPLRVTHPMAARSPKADCFYVYPTVSDQKTTLANRRVDPEERSIALYQAARYAQVCRVFAPMYRQVTVPALESGNAESPAELAVPLADVRQAFRDYLTHFNHGRPFVLIGHSQGASILRLLIAKDVDRTPAVRARLLSAIALGGNVLVKRGRAAGGDFRHVPACRHAAELGCVIAFSTFDQPAPADSIFGRTTAPGDQVLCTNPAALVGARTADAIFPSAPFAPGTIIAAGIRPAEAHPADPAHRVERGAGLVHGAVLIGRRRQRARDQPPGRRAGGRAEPGPHVGPAPRGRQHRAREPGHARPARGGRVRAAPRAAVTTAATRCEPSSGA